MPTTPSYGFPYPALTDPPNAPDQIQSLAETVEAEIVRVDSDIANAVTDTGLLTNLATSNASGWSVVVKEHRIIGNVMYLRLGIDRTGAELTGGSAGNISDNDMCTVTNAAFRPQVNQMTVVRFSNTGGTVEFTAGTGVIKLTDVHTNGVISTGNTGQVNFVYPLP